MMDTLQRKVENYTKGHKRKKFWRRVVSGLAAVAVFCTTYAMILPAITWERSLVCEIPEHCHDDSCYETVIVPEEKQLVCGLEEHSHGLECYESVLICNKEECEGHTHGEDCFNEIGELVCTIEESDGHVHSEACYGNALVCTEEEHTHTDECYEVVCEEHEEKVLICQLEEHEHTAACFDAPPEVDDGYYCGKIEHTHSEEQCCYFSDGSLRCTITEHVHTLACQSDPDADKETAAVWEKTFSKVSLTGNWAEDFIAIANTQIGYTESTRNYEVQEDGTSIKGYTRYGDWYGDKYGDWCAMFVSFCLNYADISSDYVPYAQNCQAWVKKLAANGMYAAADSGYCPEKGDIIFFDNGNNGSADHVGIVSAVNTAAGTISTIEGNSGDCVAIKRYSLTDACIYGFGLLPENPEEDSETIMISAEEGSEETAIEPATEDGTAVTESGEPTENDNTAVSTEEDSETTMISAEEGSEETTIEPATEDGTAVTESGEPAENDNTAVSAEEDSETIMISAEEESEETTIEYITEDGITVTVFGKLPEGACIKLTTVQQETLDEILELVGSDTPIFAYDITIVDIFGNEWQPDELGAKVSIIGLEIPHGDLEVVHVPETGLPQHVEVFRTDEDTVEFTADGFSIYVGYTVDFHYNDLIYSLAGEDFVYLSEIVEQLGIEVDISEITNVVFSNSELVSVEYIDGDWLLTSRESFRTEETLRITYVDGRELTIRVTDPNPDSTTPVWAYHMGSSTPYGTFTTLANAVANANYTAGDTFEFHGDTTETGTINLTKSVTLLSEPGGDYTVIWSSCGNDGAISIKQAVEVTLGDGTGAGELTLNANAKGRVLYAANAATTHINLQSGIMLTGGRKDYGAGLYINNANITASMTGGSITENTATNSGGGVYVNAGAFEISGGNISQNNATSAGGGIYIKSGTIASISGGSFSGNTAGTNGKAVYQGGTLNVSGNPSFGQDQDIYLLWNTSTDQTNSSNRVLTKTGSIVASYIPVTLDASNDRIYEYRDILVSGPSCDVTSNDVSKITIVNSSAVFSEGLTLGYTVADYLTGTPVLELKDSGVVWLIRGGVCIGKYDTLYEAVNNKNVHDKVYGYTFALADNDILEFHGDTTEVKTSDIQKSIEIRSEAASDHIVTWTTVTGDNSGIRVNNSSSTVTFGNTANSSVLWLKITSNIDGRPLFITSSSHAVIKEGCALADGNRSTNKAGAVYINSGILDIQGGLITDCQAKNGGAIYVNAGTVNISGGTISENTASTTGGAIYVNAGTVNISGGTITENSAETNGGAIYMAGGAVNISGGTISENIAKTNGGAIYNATQNGLTLTGGTFSGNEAVTVTNGVSSYGLGNAIYNYDTETVSVYLSGNPEFVSSSVVQDIYLPCKRYPKEGVNCYGSIESGKIATIKKCGAITSVNPIPLTLGNARKNIYQFRNIVVSNDATQNNAVVASDLDKFVITNNQQDVAFQYLSLQFTSNDADLSLPVLELLNDESLFYDFVIDYDVDNTSPNASKTATFNSAQDEVEIVIEEKRENLPVLVLGDVCTAHGLTKDTIRSAINKMAEKADVEYYLGGRMSTNTSSTGTFYGPYTGTVRQGNTMTNSQYNAINMYSGAHDCGAYFAKTIVEKLESGNYSKIVMIFDNALVANGNSYAYSSADRVNFYKAAKLMESYYANNNVIWITSTDHSGGTYDGLQNQGYTAGALLQGHNYRDDFSKFYYNDARLATDASGRKYDAFNMFFYMALFDPETWLDGVESNHIPSWSDYNINTRGVFYSNVNNVLSIVGSMFRFTWIEITDEVVPELPITDTYLEYSTDDMTWSALPSSAGTLTVNGQNVTARVTDSSYFDKYIRVRILCSCPAEFYEAPDDPKETNVGYAYASFYDNNTLTDRVQLDPPTLYKRSSQLLSVEKTFTGLTATQIQELINDFCITLTDGNGNAVLLRLDDSGVTVSQNNMTYTWEVSLEQGQYNITETGADLPGYIKTVNGLGTITIPDDTDLEITNVYETGCILPETGGIGIYSIYVLGILLVACSITSGYVLWRKRERGDE